MAERRNPGDHVVLVETWRGRVFSVRPATVVLDAPQERRLLVWPGQVSLAARSPDGTWLRTPSDRPWSLEPVTWRRGWILSFSWPGRPHAVLAFLSHGLDVEGWYVNLETPLEPIPEGFAYEDLVLDARVAADRSAWSWKDEDDLAAAVADGRLTAKDAERLRAEGLELIHRVLRAEPPFDLDRRGWRPDPSWRPPPPPDPTRWSGEAGTVEALDDP